MNLPFTTEQFLSVFEQYNHAVWPFQVALNLLGLVALVLAARRVANSDKVVSLILAFLWLWIGTAYHLLFFTSINGAAYAFGILNVLQGAAFIYFGVLTPRLSFKFRNDAYGIVGWVFVSYALILYPVLGYFLGHVYPKSPTFGLPCPTTIFTFGVLLWTTNRVPRLVLVIPVLWSIVGFSAALTLGIREDVGLLVAGIVSLLLLLFRDRNASRTEMGISQAT